MTRSVHVVRRLRKRSEPLSAHRRGTGRRRCRGRWRAALDYRRSDARLRDRESFPRPLRRPTVALGNMIRVLRPGGVLYLAVPDKRYTFDADRPVTPTDHLLRDHREGRKALAAATTRSGRASSTRSTSLRHMQPRFSSAFTASTSTRGPRRSCSSHCERSRTSSSSISTSS
jgi:hypothetical protein